MTHHLAGLAAGRVVVALEGGYNLDIIAQVIDEMISSIDKK